MAIPANKNELLEAIRTNYSRLRAELNTITPEAAARQELEGHAKGTLMSINNLVAYLLGWGQLVLKWHLKKSKGEPVDLPETGFKWNELGLLAQKFYADHSQDDLPALLGKLDTTVNDLVKLVESKSNAQLYKEPWYETWPLGRMIQLNSASPYANAKARVRKWKKQHNM